MISFRRISRALILLALVGMIGVSAAGFFRLRGDLAMLQRLSMERIEWKSAQIETELARFDALLGNWEAGALGAPELREAAELLRDLTESYLNGAAGARIAAYDENGLLGRVSDLVARIHVAVGQGGALATDDSRAIRAEAAALAEPLRALSRAVVWGEELRFHAIRSDLRRGAEVTLTLCIAAMVLAAALVGALLTELQRHRRESRESRELAARATEASRAKSRFLTMMSHELRTPMNGVLGLVALARQSGLTEAQERLLDHAERSGRLMIAQLADILDFAELDREDLLPDSAPFPLDDLRRALDDQFGPVARRDGVAFGVRVLGAGRPCIRSDQTRLAQIGRHLMSFLLERVAVSEIAVTLEHADGALCMVLEADEPPEGAPGWRFDAALGGGGAVWGAIESDAFGPAIARALVGRLGGRIEVERERPGRARLVVTVPAEGGTMPGPVVRVEVASPTMRAVCTSLLQRLGAAEWRAGEAGGDPDAVLVEAGAEGVGALVPALRSCHPGVRIVGLGAAAADADFDAALPYPPGLDDLRDAVPPRLRPEPAAARKPSASSRLLAAKGA